MTLSPAFVTTINNVSFSDAADIDNYFVKTGGQDFVSWFNQHVAGKENWGKVGPRAALAINNSSLGHSRFNQLWSNESIQTIFGTGKISLLQFVALQSIMINETGGQLAPITEGVGSAGHPGIAYAFDEIPGLKRSYNTLPSNKNCLQVFNDANYNKAFGNLPLADKLKNTADKTWEGEVFPQHTTPTSTSPALSGYVLEADFFKFRGRGFIQTTGRTNYAKLITYVQNYKGSNACLTAIKAKWANLSNEVDALASMSSNADWDGLFQNSDCLVAGFAINVHNSCCGDYLQHLNEANETVMMNSLTNMGLRISGANNYANLFQNRVMQILSIL